jgi:phage shock protein PspC (stress-responsive transcriptional regulator)
MNKTIAIELGGLRFHLQQDAYSTLEAYLLAIEAALQADPSSSEIVGDIESRIAELLQERLAGLREVVNDDDVRFIMEAIGEPSDFEDEDAEGGQSKPNPGIRRLFRDPDEAMIGGVAAGLSAYFGIDPVWIRGAFVLTTITGGFGIPLYVVLWLIVPMAETRAERLTMRGRPVNFENLRNVVGQEVNQASRRVRRWGRDAGQTTRRGMASAGKGLSEIFAFVLRGIGWFLLISMLILFVVMGTSVLAFLSGYGGLDIAGLHVEAGSPLVDALALVLPEGVSTNAVRISAVLLLVMPLVVLSMAVIRLLFRPRIRRGFFAAGIAFSLLISIGGATFLGVIAARVALEFRAEAKLGQNLPLRASTTGLVSLGMPAIPSRPGDVWFSDDSGPGLFLLDQERLAYDAIEVDIEPTNEAHPRLAWEIQASGASRHQARERCLEVDFPVEVSSDSTRVTLPEMLSFPVANRFRGQSVQVTLYVPTGNTVDIHASLSPYLRNIQNADNVRSAKLAGRSWTMTENGLVSFSQE